MLVWKQSLENGEYRTITIKQRRICFTELARSQVKEHGKTFGPFSLEWRIDALRRLGALPVIYVPQHLKDDREFSAVGATIVAELADIKYTVSQLHQLSKLTDPQYLLAHLAPEATSVAEDYFFDLRNTDAQEKVVASYQVPSRSIKDILSYIGYRNAPFDLMVGVLSLVQNLFCPTDDEKHDRPLEYYRQREWRLSAGLALKGISQDRTLTDRERETLLSIDRTFWNKELSDGKTSFRRVDDACVVDRYGGRHIAESIFSIVVPPEAYEEARDLFGDKVLVADESNANLSPRE